MTIQTRRSIDVTIILAPLEVSSTSLTRFSIRSCFSSTYDSDSGKNIFAYEKDVDRDGAAYVYSPAYSNAPDFIGITDQAIADTATGAVIVQGGVSDKVTGLTTGSDYYVQADGTLSTTVSSVPAGRALSSTSILLEG